MKETGKQKISFSRFFEEYGAPGKSGYSFQTHEDSVVPIQMQLQPQKNPGIFFGTMMKSFSKESLPRYYVGKPQSIDGHCAVFGSSGSGKGSCIAVPTMISWGNSPMVVLDPKGDLSEYYNRFMQTAHTKMRPAKIFNPAADNTCTYDPFSHIRNDNESNRIANIRELVNAIIPKPLDSKERFWVAAAQKILISSLLYYLDSTIEIEGEEDKLSFYGAIDCITRKPLEELIDEINRSENDDAKKYIRSFNGKDYLSDSEMFTDINETLDTYLMNFINDKRIQKALIPLGNTIDWERDLGEYNIFLSIPEDRIEQWGPLLNVMITQLIRALERRPEHYSPQGADLKPVLLLLDEFPMIGRIDVLANALSMLRSKNVTILLIAQSISQLSAIYGRDCRNIMLENCDFQAVLRVNCAESQRYFSDLSGVVPMRSWSVSSSNKSDMFSIYEEIGKFVKHDRFEEMDRMSSDYSENIRFSLRPFIRPEELAHLNQEMILFTPYRTFCVEKNPFFDWESEMFELFSVPQNKWDENNHTEIIDGEEYTIEPPSSRHQEISDKIFRQMENSLKRKKGKVYVSPFPVRLFERSGDKPDDVDTVVIPDIFVVCKENKIDEHGCKGAPDMIIEILSPSSLHRDRLVKLKLYQRARVREYWIVDPKNLSIQVFLRDDRGSLSICRDYGKGDIAKIHILEDCFIDLRKVFYE